MRRNSNDYWYSNKNKIIFKKKEYIKRNGDKTQIKGNKDNKVCKNEKSFLNPSTKFNNTPPESLNFKRVAVGTFLQPHLSVFLFLYKIVPTIPPVILFLKDILDLKISVCVSSRTNILCDIYSGTYWQTILKSFDMRASETGIYELYCNLKGLQCINIFSGETSINRIGRNILITTNRCIHGFINYTYPRARRIRSAVFKTNKSKTIETGIVYFTKRNPILRITFKIKSLRFFILLLLMAALPQVYTYTHAKYGVDTIKTKYGLLRGIVIRYSPLVEAYLGIPYASPPIGSLRFMPPITPSSWKGVRIADRFAPVCPQTVPIPPNGPEALLEVPRARLAQFRRLLPLLSNQSEDCLYLNIYIPKRSSSENKSNQQSSHEVEPNATINKRQIPIVKEKIPTILFIHGESYEWNSGNPYDGSELAAFGNIIVVTINFRLGILGFLKTGGKESAQGNFGLMDLVAGLHWLKENLPSFGGDSSRITVMGHGTGAALANILLVSPVASDLIKRGVLLSGSAVSPWAIQRYPLFIKRRVAEQTGCHGDVLYDDLAPCLRTKKLTELLAVKVDYPRFLAGFAPFVDGTVIPPTPKSISTLKLPVGSAIISTSGIELANFPKHELMFGLTSVESYLDLSAQDLEFGLNETYGDNILRTYVRNVFQFHLNEIFAVLKNEYTDWERAIRNPFASRDSTLSYLSDGHTASGLIKIGYMHNLRGGRGFFLHFKHKTDEEEYPLRSGSVHGEDLPFWFGLPISPLFPKNYSLQERRLSATMVKYLSNFVKTGNPNQSKTTTEDTEQENKFEAVSHANKDRRKANNTIETFKSTTLTKRHTSLFPIFRDRMNSQREVYVTRPKRSNMQIKGSKIQNVRKSKSEIDSHAQRSSEKFDDMLKDDVKQRTITSIQSVPHWEIYDSVHQLYLELGNKAQTRSHYRGHKLSMWLHLIPQLHKNSYLNDLSVNHSQFMDEMTQFSGELENNGRNNRMNNERRVYTDADLLKSSNKANNLSPDTPFQVISTECNVNATEFSTMSSSAITNNSNMLNNFPDVLENMDVLRRLNSKQMQSYATALVATIGVGCLLLLLNILIFAGIYHQREKRAKDAEKKERLKENETVFNENLTPSKSFLNIPDKLLQSSSLEKVSFNSYDCFKNEIHQETKRTIIDVNGSGSQSVTESSRRGKNKSIDLLNNKRIKDDTNAHGSQKDETTYLQEISHYDSNDSARVKQDENINSIPEILSSPKFIQLNHLGILRISDVNDVNPTNKKRVHIQEISV